MLSRRHISDHAPVIVAISTRGRLAPDDQPVPAWVCREPRFAELTKLWFEQVPDIENLCPNERWSTVKTILKEAARQTRDEICITRTSDPNVLDMTLSSISRALWSNDVQLAEVILARSPLAAGWISVCSDKVLLVSPEAFQQFTDTHRRTFRAKEWEK